MRSAAPSTFAILPSTAWRRSAWGGAGRGRFELKRVRPVGGFRRECGYAAEAQPQHHNCVAFLRRLRSALRERDRAARECTTAFLLVPVAPPPSLALLPLEDSGDAGACQPAAAVRRLGRIAGPFPPVVVHRLLSSALTAAIE